MNVNFGLYGEYGAAVHPKTGKIQTIKNEVFSKEVVDGLLEQGKIVFTIKQELRS